MYDLTAEVLQDILHDILMDTIEQDKDRETVSVFRFPEVRYFHGSQGDTCVTVGLTAKQIEVTCYNLDSVTPTGEVAPVVVACHNRVTHKSHIHYPEMQNVIERSMADFRLMLQMGLISDAIAPLGIPEFSNLCSEIFQDGK